MGIRCPQLHCCSVVRFRHLRKRRRCRQPATTMAAAHTSKHTPVAEIGRSGNWSAEWRKQAGRLADSESTAQKWKDTRLQQVQNLHSGVHSSFLGTTAPASTFHVPLCIKSLPIVSLSPLTFSAWPAWMANAAALFHISFMGSNTTTSRTLGT